jgi:NADH-quinone oxidoreductase subunit G
MKPHPINPFNHDIAPPDTPLVNVQVDGAWVQVPKGMNVVEVVRQQGKFLPHYCYHPKLSISGNCRMCLFEMGTPKMTPERKPVIGEDGKPEIAWMPRPQIGCATQVSDGMGIRTDSPLARECRNGVMEFLLINHPLDCPICDQAGECKLQEYSTEYGTRVSRFEEEKVKKPKNVDLGERIVLDDERCILCSRCIRFSKEVVQDDVLGFVNRGGHSVLTAHPGKRLDNNYSLNTVDICPVGALTSKDFRFKMRVWFLKETESICTSCGTGCNITVGSREQTVYRLTPRENEAVNSQWMCDQGRLNFHYLEDDRRIKSPLVRIGNDFFPASWADANRQLGSRLKEFGPGEVAIVASASMTNEELYLVKKLADELNVELMDVVPKKGEADGFLRSDDLNANSRGAELLGVSKQGQALARLSSAIDAGRIKALLAFHEDVTGIGVTVEQLSKLSLVVLTTLLPNFTMERAHYVLPGAGFAEKRGSLINVHGRLQRLNKAVSAPGNAKEDWEILRDLRFAATGGNGVTTIEDVFRAMALEVPAFEGLSLSKIGPLGVALAGLEASQRGTAPAASVLI